MEKLVTLLIVGSFLFPLDFYLLLHFRKKGPIGNFHFSPFLYTVLK